MGSSGVSLNSVTGNLVVSGSTTTTGINNNTGDITNSGSVTGIHDLAQVAGFATGFFGKVRVGQQASVAAPVATASTSVAPFGYATAAQADAIVSNINNIRAALIAYGLLS